MPMLCSQVLQTLTDGYTLRSCYTEFANRALLWNKAPLPGDTFEKLSGYAVFTKCQPSKQYIFQIMHIRFCAPAPTLEFEELAHETTTLPTYEAVLSIETMLSLCMHCARVQEQDICEAGNQRASCFTHAIFLINTWGGGERDITRGPKLLVTRPSPTRGPISLGIQACRRPISLVNQVPQRLISSLSSHLSKPGYAMLPTSCSRSVVSKDQLQLCSLETIAA